MLSKHGQHSATSLTAARLHEREFEKFYFTSMVSTPASLIIDKTSTAAIDQKEPKKHFLEL